MTCCDNSHVKDKSYPKKATCPVNGKSYRQVKRRTVLHHIKQPQDNCVPEQGYYFCSSPTCDVVYFAENGDVFDRDKIREEVLQKQMSTDRILCYCFGINEKTVEQEVSSYGYSLSYSFVIEQTKKGTCACELRNPSGRCCLADFPESVKKRTTRQ